MSTNEVKAAVIASAAEQFRGLFETHYDAIRKAVALPEFAEKLAGMGMAPAYGDAAKVTSITQHEAANIKRAMEVATIRYGE